MRVSAAVNRTGIPAVNCCIPTEQPHTSQSCGSLQINPVREAGMATQVVGAPAGRVALEEVIPDREVQLARYGDTGAIEVSPGALLELNVDQRRPVVRV